MSDFDTRELRTALGNYATGVTVITAKHPEKGLVGITANSFSSVSLDPPLVLWCLAKSARSLDIYLDVEYFAVNVLAADQVSLSNHFAVQQPDKFAVVDFTAGLGDAPLLNGCAADFQCKTVGVHDAGDHTIFLGEVLEFRNHRRASLLYHDGQYAVSQPHPVTNQDQGVPDDSGLIGNYLDYLLARCSDLMQRQFGEVVEQAVGLTPVESRVLVIISFGKGPDIDMLRQHSTIDSEDIEAGLDKLEQARLIRRDGRGNQEITEEGRDVAEKLVEASRAHEADALGALSLEQVQRLKETLIELIVWMESASSSPASLIAKKFAGK